MYLFLGKGISALLPKNSLVCLQISIMNHSSELGFVSSDPWKSFWMTVQICSSAWNKCHFHREPRQNFFFPWKTLWWNPCYIKSGFALRRRISVSASHNYLSVQEHIWDCFSSIRKGFLEKCSTPNIGAKSRGITEKQEPRTALCAFQLFIG